MGRAARILCLDESVTTPDGVALATDVTVADDGERHPVLLFRTPYGRSSVRAFHDAIGLARLGFAVVTQDVRGRWDSAGAFSPFHSERADGAATLAWCADQPWSSGAVAMAGASYNGFTQWLAAAARPSALRAIAPAVSGPTIRDAIYEGGALQLGVFSAWTLGIGAVGSNLDADVVAAAIADLDGWPRLLETGVHPDGHGADGLEKSTLARISADWARWLDPDDADLWDSLDAARVLGPASASPGDTGASGQPDGRPQDGRPPAGYHLAGWHDLFCEQTIRGYTLLAGDGTDERAHRRQRLVVGPWSHGTMLRRTTGLLDFGVTAQGELNGIPEEQVAFMSAALAGGDVPHGVRVFLMGSNRWLDLPGWPPPATETSLFLADDGALSWSEPAETGTDSYRHDPADPVPTGGGRTLHPVPPAAGPLDQRPVEERPDVLVYTSPALGQDLSVVGTVRADVVFASTAPVADVAVKLVDVHPDGRAMLVTDSIRRTSATPGTAREVAVEVGSTALTFAAGHRIRVEVASSSYPRFDTCPAGEQTVHRGGRARSRVVLPVLDQSPAVDTSAADTTHAPGRS